MYNTDYKTTKYSRGVNTKEYIIMHHTASTASDINIVKYLAENPAQVSCHYVIGKDGTIYQIATDDKITRHAGESKRDGKTNMNKYSIGIEVHSDGLNFTDEQKHSARQLVNDLITKYKIPVNRIIRHADVAPNRKTDIGLNFCKPLTWTEYQNTYSDNKAKNAINSNSELWENTDDEVLRYILNQTNNYIRQKYGL